MTEEKELREICIRYISAVYRLSRTIESRARINMEVKLQEKGGLGFWANSKKFAQVNCEGSGTIIYIGTKKKWALEAGVTDLAHGHKINGWHGSDDESFWRIDVHDDDKLQDTAIIVAKICQARLKIAR